MLKVHAKGLLKTKTTQGFKAKENEGTLKETKFPQREIAAQASIPRSPTPSSHAICPICPIYSYVEKHTE